MIIDAWMRHPSAEFLSDANAERIAGLASETGSRRNG